VNKYLSILKDGLIYKNPVLVLLLGMCPALAVTTTLENGVGMGLIVSAALVCSGVVISLLRNILPDAIRLTIHIVIIAGFVSCADMLLRAYSPELRASLGIYLPLIVVSGIVLSRAEDFASKNNVLAAAVDGLSMGLGFTVALTLLSAIREILGSGTLMGFALLGADYTPVLFFALPAGGFITLGCLIALAQKLLSKQRGGMRP